MLSRLQRYIWPLMDHIPAPFIPLSICQWELLFLISLKQLATIFQVSLLYLTRVTMVISYLVSLPPVLLPSNTFVSGQSEWTFWNKDLLTACCCIISYMNFIVQTLFHNIKPFRTGPGLSFRSQLLQTSSGHLFPPSVLWTSK